MCLSAATDRLAERSGLGESLVLVLDADAAAARKLHGQLREAGFLAIPATSPTEALAALRQVSVDIIVVTIDVALPSDLAFLEELHRSSLRAWIIVASARGGERARQTVFQHDGDALVSPLPCTLENLMPALGAFTARSRPLLR